MYDLVKPTFAPRVMPRARKTAGAEPVAGGRAKRAVDASAAAPSTAQPAEPKAKRARKAGAAVSGRRSQRTETELEDEAELEDELEAEAEVVVEAVVESDSGDDIEPRKFYSSFTLPQLRAECRSVDLDELERQQG